MSETTQNTIVSVKPESEFRRPTWIPGGKPRSADTERKTSENDMVIELVEYLMLK